MRNFCLIYENYVENIKLSFLVAHTLRYSFWQLYFSFSSPVSKSDFDRFLITRTYLMCASTVFFFFQNIRLLSSRQLNPPSVCYCNSTLYVIKIYEQSIGKNRYFIYWFCDDRDDIITVRFMCNWSNHDI